MSHHQATAFTSKTSTDLFPPAPVVRASNDREQRLTDYVRGHTGADITVWLSAAVETAFVAPTTEAALVEADESDLARDDAKRVVEQIDPEYVIAIPTKPARLDRLPLDDQLTADRAQQFGFALHELGHIRYTNIGESAALLNDAVEEAHKEFVHSLWNLCEDAAIEQQLATDQSQIAADRLALHKQSLNSHATDLSEDTHRPYTFRDAIELALFDWGIYETGYLNVLCDPDDDRLTFHSAADRQAYESITDDLEQLLADILTTPDSIARTERVLECWQDVVKPLLDPIDEESSQPTAGHTSDIDTAAKDDAAAPHSPASDAADGSTVTDETRERPGDEHSSVSTPEQTATTSDRATRPRPEAINTERTQDISQSNVLEYPSIGETEPAEQLAPDEQSHLPTDETSTEVPTHHPDKANNVHPDAGATAQNEPGSEPAPTEGEKEAPGPSSETADASPSMSDPDEDGQTTLSLFRKSESTESEQTDGTSITPAAADQATQQHDASDSEQKHSPTDTQDDHHPTDTHPSNPLHAETTDEALPSSSPSETAARQTSTKTNTERAADEKEAIDHGTTQPASTAPAHTSDQLDRDNALAADEQAAHQEADRVIPDEQALDAELGGVAEALDNRSTGSGATPDSLDELSLLPDRDAPVDPTRWGDATASAQCVGNTLRTALRESQRDSTRSGLTSGTFDRRRVGALARGEINVFQVRQPGEDKDYDLVLVLDRSSSMRNCITTAENALIRFVLACEAIGINVAVIDFVDREARLVKPFTVECAFARGSLMTSETGGGTPLGDALGLARELLEQRHSNPLILIVSDGRPGNPEAYHEELTACYAPVCGLTLVLNHASGEIPTCVADNEQFFDRHEYVHDPERLDDRLDQFAMMFDGL